MDDKFQIVDEILMSNFVHQIINPLNGTVGTLDNLIDGSIPPERRDQRLRSVRAQLVNSIELIRNLAHLSMLQTNQGIESIRAKMGEVNIPNTIIEAILIFQEYADSKHIKIELKDGKTQYVINGHVGLLRQVFINIFDNCIKYGDADTKIIIDTRIQKKTNQFVIDILSNGVGFNYDEKERIFELGFRGESASQIKASGSGIGLYICKRIIELVHFGTIEAEHSSSNRETLFRIRFLNVKIIGEK